MNKLDRYDSEKLVKAKLLINEVYDYNYISESDKLTRKLNTILDKIDKVLETETEQEVHNEYVSGELQRGIVE